MMPPGYVPMESPSFQGVPVYGPPPQQQPQFAQGPPRQQPQRPVVRGSAPEEKEKKPARREPASLPSPDEIGIKPAPPPDPNVTDWNAAYARMKTMGVLGFEMPQPVQAGYRFAVVMQTSEAGRTYRIEGTGASEAAAVRACLDKTDRWLKQVP
jgi:hypothetical protein